MRRLPIDKESRLREIMIECKLGKYIFSEEDIELIANEKRICYICESPTFQITYIIDGNTSLKNYYTESMKFGKDFFKAIQEKYLNGEIYVFNSLNNGIIRGCFIKDFEDIMAKDRDDRISEVLK